MDFCTVINCMDGRVQLPVIEHLQKRFNAKYVDSITEPGPNLILSEQNNPILVKHILDRLKISIENTILWALLSLAISIVLEIQLRKKNK